MPDQFWVNHGNYGEVNVGLAHEEQKMDVIISDLNATLSRISEASNGKATPLWAEQQTTWNRTYADMKTQLNGHTTSSFKVADTFKEGDDQGARVMS